MSKFFKYFLAVVVGSIVSAIFFVFGTLIIFSAIAASGSGEVIVKENSILVLDLNGEIVERTSNDPFSDMFSDMLGQSKTLGLNKILSSIKKAKEDDRIKGIYLESSDIIAGYATIDEVRNALLDFKESGKFIYSFSPIYTQKAYYLASVSDKVLLNPTGTLEFKGLASVQTFFKGSLEKLGIEVQVFKYGQFKSAVEPFIADKMSDAARLQTETYLNSMWGHMLKGISESRGIDVETLNNIADEFVSFKGDDALLASGLIDGIVYKDEVLDMLKELTNIELKKDLNAISINKYADVFVPGKKKGLEKNKIAVIYAEGEITDGESDGAGIVSGPLSRAIREARRDESIKAIVLRVNSPGGSALASEIIWREMQLAKETKPVVVSMGDYAASGGYYISCAADSIVAHPNTLTGSIGVFGLVPNVAGLSKKMGITTDRVTTNAMADMPALGRPFTSAEQKLMQMQVNSVYETFTQRCADGRNTTSESIDKIGEGRVWSGENAIEINLVDKLGGINDAIEIAARMAEVETYRIVELPEMLSPFDKIMKDLTGGAVAKIEQMVLGEEYKILKTINQIKSGNIVIQTRIPYDITIY